MWKYIVLRGWSLATIWPMHIACWIPKATNTHTLMLCNSHFFPLQQWLHERASMLHYTYIACIVTYEILYSYHLDNIFVSIVSVVP